MKFPQLVISEPYRLFFPLGWMMGIVGVTYWLLVSAGIAKSYAALYHGLIQIELFGAAFAVGFLLTALPKFLRTRAATNAELLCLFAAYLVLSGAMLMDFLYVAQWSFILFIVLLVRFASIRVRERKAMPPFSFLLVGFGLLEGVLGAFLIMYPSSSFPLLGQKLLEQGMLLSLSLGVGSFLGPRLMGVVDVTNASVSLPKRAPDNLPWYRSPSAVVLLIGALIFASFFIETGWNRDAGMYLRAGAGLFCLARFGVLKFPKSGSVVGILVALALWTMVLGILVAALLPQHEIGALHLTFIGGFGFLILAIAAQVTSSHGGVQGFWHVHKTAAIVIAALVILSALIRAGATFFPTLYFVLIGASALLFDAALVVWGVGVLRHIGSRTQHG